jgi:ketosteroid isomerase-like protein
MAVELKAARGDLYTALGDFYDALGNDVESALEMLDPDVELIQLAEKLDRAPVYKGHAGVIKSLDETRETFPDFSYKLEQLYDAGDGNRYVAIVRVTGTGIGSGAAVENIGGNFLTLRDGKIIRVEIYADPDLAFAAAGIPASG